MRAKTRRRPGIAGGRAAIPSTPHNLSVVQTTGKHHVPYPFQVCNGSDHDREFAVTAWPAPLKNIEAFLPGIAGGRTLFHRPGKVERLGLIASAKADAAHLEKAPASLSRVEIPRRSCRQLTLGVSLPSGSALIHVTQSLDGRIVGGLSVLATAEAK